MPKIPEHVPDSNPPIVKWTKKDGVLEKETTHKDPVVHIESHNIKELQSKIDKIDGVIAQWEAKKVPFQSKIDKYEELTG